MEYKEYKYGIEVTRPLHINTVKKVERKDEYPIDTIVEGLLFIVGDEGLKIEQCAAVMDVTLKGMEEVFSRLMFKYQKKEYAFELVNYGGNYKFLSKSYIHPFASKLFQTTKTNALSQSALETLAIVAYRQPITRVEIEELRGVGCDMMLRKLQARNLIQEMGRSDAPGKPFLYGVTEEFMDSFKLISLDELPELPDFSSDENENLFE